jgi:hypothetical protein
MKLNSNNNKSKRSRASMVLRRDQNVVFVKKDSHMQTVMASRLVSQEG